MQDIQNLIGSPRRLFFCFKCVKYGSELAPTFLKLLIFYDL